jgi:hypothetical protein
MGTEREQKATGSETEEVQSEVETDGDAGNGRGPEVVESVG